LFIRNDELDRHRGLVHERPADQVGADVGLQRAAVKNLLHAVGLHRGADAELQWPAPSIRHQVAAQVAARLLQHGQEAQVQARAGRHGGTSLAKRTLLSTRAERDNDFSRTTSTKPQPAILAVTHPPTQVCTTWATDRLSVQFCNSQSGAQKVAE